MPATGVPATALADGYELGAGNLTLDLTGLVVGPGTTTVNAAVGAGELHVTVPEGARVEVESQVDVGVSRLFGDAESGLGVVQRATSGGEAGSVLRLVLSVDAGEIEVTR